MGVVCCKQLFTTTDYSSFEDCVGPTTINNDVVKPNGKSSEESNSPDRDTWFTERYTESGDEELYTKDINLCDFEIKCCIGKGAYSKVFLVNKIDNGKPYAMKVIKKSILEDDKHKQRVCMEKEILQSIDSPFIVKLHFSFQTADKLYFILDFVNGGELYSKLTKHYKIGEKRARIYAAEILMALKTLHENGVIYRDLKSRNILLDSEGHIKLIDFGLSKIKNDTNCDKKVICGTAHYVSPEMLLGREHTEVMDYWSLGVLLYEMLHGYFPFGKYITDSKQIFEEVIKNPLKTSRKLSEPARDLLEGLLKKNPLERLGARGIHEIMDHEFFKGLEWSRDALKPPYIPKLKKMDDTKYIEDYYMEEGIESSPDHKSLSKIDKKVRYVRGFSFSSEKDESSLIAISKYSTSHKLSI